MSGLTYRERLATQNCPICRAPLIGRGVFQKANGVLYHYDCHQETIVPNQLQVAQQRLNAQPADLRASAAARAESERVRGERLGMIRRWRQHAREEIRGELLALSIWGRFRFLVTGRTGG